MKEEMYRKLKGIASKSPVLLVNKAAILFREGYSKEIYHVENQEELKELVERFTNTPYSGVLVIDDISKIWDLSVLLKFLEEATFPIILLAYKDTNTLSTTILSRIKTYIKYPYDVVSTNLTNAKDALDIWRVEQDKSNQDRFYAQESPELYYLRIKSTRFKCNTKIVELLAKE